MRWLLVEDQISVRRVTAKSLRKLGYAVIETEDAMAALKLWETQPQQIDLLFTDMVMPGGMTGLDLAKLLKKENKSLKVIISSGYNAQMIEPNELADLAISFLHKPYTSALLAKTVRDCLDRT